jgi:single-strand DNA-binding protein
MRYTGRSINGEVNMASVNKWIGVGNLGKDPEMKTMQNGKAIASFSIACSESWKDKSGSKQERTTWVNCTAFDKLAEICGKYLVKGKQVYVEGRLQTDKYEKDGQTQYSTKIVLSDMKMLGTKGDSAANNSNANSGNTAPAQAAGDPEDSIPF